MRRLAPEEAALWKRVIESVKPIRPAKVEAAAEASKPLPFRGGVGVGPISLTEPSAKRTGPSPKGEGLKKDANTLDGSWDRRLARGLVAPESSIDLHGHNLSSAYDRLDRGLEQAVAQGDRVLLLITGKPPAPDSERPHSRGAIRAAVGDWLKASRFSDRIAAVRGAHPRHGGSGALYIVLRRPRA
ncbi:MAG: Smr/MutS family protein [Pseudomonadota bacterium]